MFKKGEEKISYSCHACARYFAVFGNNGQQMEDKIIILPQQNAIYGFLK